MNDNTPLKGVNILCYARDEIKEAIFEVTEACYWNYWGMEINFNSLHIEILTLKDQLAYKY